MSVTSQLWQERGGKKGGEKRREIEGKTVWRVYTSGQTGCPQLVRGREMKGGDSKSKRTCSRRVVRRCVAIKEDTKRGLGCGYVEHSTFS